MSGDLVPFQLRKVRPQWKPVPRMTGLMAETSPAMAAAAGRRMPKSTTVTSHSMPVVAGVVTLLTLCWNDTKKMPPTAATPADRAKRPSLVRSGDTPGGGGGDL